MTQKTIRLFVPRTNGSVLFMEKGQQSFDGITEGWGIEALLKAG